MKSFLKKHFLKFCQIHSKKLFLKQFEPFVCVLNDFSELHEEGRRVADDLLVEGDVHRVEQVREVLQPVDGRDVVLQLADRQLVVDGAGVNPGHFGDRYLAKIIRFRFQALFWD